jgi:DNA repair ATPase RecN
MVERAWTFRFYNKKSSEDGHAFDTWENENRSKKEIMSIKVTIRGFQSIKHPVEILVEGYSVIEGESNLGKSAVIRAIHAALSNRAGTEFITEEESVCEVVIKSLGHTVRWSKDHKSTFYEVDGVKISKPGRGTVPDEVRAAGLYAIKTIDKELHWPQIHFQWEQPFIIGAYTDTLAAELLGASQDTVKIGRAIKLVNGDVTKCKARVEFLEKQHQELVTSVAKMEDMADRLNALQRMVDHTEKVKDEALKQESTYQDLVDKYRSFWGGWKISSAVAKVSVPATLDVSYHEKLVNLYRRYTQTCFLMEVSSKNQDAVPAILDGREYITEITRLDRELNQVSRQIQTTGPVVSIQQPQKVDGQGIVNRIHSLKGLREQYLRAQKDLDSSVRVTGEINIELKQVDGEREKLRYLVGSIERCPLCSAPMKDGCYCPEEGTLVG